MSAAIESRNRFEPEWLEAQMRLASGPGPLSPALSPIGGEGVQVVQAPIVRTMTAADVAAAEQITEAQARRLLRLMARVVPVYSLPVAGARGLRIDPGDYLTWKARLPRIERTEKSYTAEIDSRCAERDNRLVALGVIRIGPQTSGLSDVLQRGSPTATSSMGLAARFVRET